MRLTDFMPESLKSRKLADETRSEKTAETPDKPSQSNVEPEPSTSCSNTTKESKKFPEGMAWEVFLVMRGQRKYEISG